MAPPALPNVVIVGGGFSGAMVAVHLARQATTPLRIDIIEPRPVLGGGVAYSAADPAHRINVPAARMTVFAEDPAQFDRWLRQTHALENDPAASWTQELAFPQRAVFGQYIAGLLDAAAGLPGITLHHHRARATDIAARPAGFTVQLDTGGALDADILVLAVSHPPPSVPSPLRDVLAQGAPVIADPWSPGALDGIAPDASVLIVGTGLTMADVVATLDRRGHRGSITALSRRGLLSRGHAFAPAAAWQWAGTAPPPPSALALVRAIRDQVDDARAQGVAWQLVFDDVRAHGRRLWGALPEAEQRRIVRHIRPYWDVHRFRVAPQIETAIARRRATGQFTSLAGSLRGATWDGSRFAVRLRPRRAPADACETRLFDAIVVTTGPAHEAVISTNPALAALARQGLIGNDRIGLGLLVDDASRAIGQGGATRPDLRVAGPLARGRFGELMGLPQVSEHAEDVATRITTLLLPASFATTATVTNAAA